MQSSAEITENQLQDFFECLHNFEVFKQEL